jgi:hypothetical protein
VNARRGASGHEAPRGPRPRTQLGTRGAPVHCGSTGMRAGARGTRHSTLPRTCSSMSSSAAMSSEWSGLLGWASSLSSSPSTPPPRRPRLLRGLCCQVHRGPTAKRRSAPGQGGFGALPALVPALSTLGSSSSTAACRVLLAPAYRRQLFILSRAFCTNSRVASMASCRCLSQKGGARGLGVTERRVEATLLSSAAALRGPRPELARVVVSHVCSDASGTYTRV